jgi:hypothetical protein
MVEIRDLLNKFNNILLSEKGKKEFIGQAISETIKTKISSGDVEIKNNIIYLNIKPIYKNEIFLKQELIFLRLKELLGERAPQNIK